VVLSKTFKVPVQDKKPVKQSETVQERPYSKESFNGETLEIKWNPKAIACTSDNTNKEFSEIILDDLAEINKKLNKKDGRNTYIKHVTNNQNNVHDLFIKELLRPKTWKPNEDNSFNFSSELIHRLCDETEEILKKQPIVLRVKAPIKIFGDIHGQ